MNALLSLFGLSLYFGLALVARVLWHRQATGHSGFHGLSGRPGSIAWTSGVAFAIAPLFMTAGPIMELVGFVRPLCAAPALFVLGVAAVVIGTAGTILAQSQMGASWRVGVRTTERTALVTNGVYALVRNPIFSFMLVAFAGVVLLAPDALTIAGFLLLLVSVELHVRLVEEPHLRRVHDVAYAHYAARVGRFVPGIGYASSRFTGTP
jgi:protein-S-isoprenylcysteine O-methyltransferase Ste14